MIDHLILTDLDETLVDRDAVVRQWAEETSRASGRPELSDWLVEFDRDAGHPCDGESFLAGVATKLGWDEPTEQLLAEWPTSFGSRYRLAQATADALRRARQKGFRLAVVSNGDRDRQQAKIDAMGLSTLVDAWVISGEVGVREPEREIFEIAAARAGTDLSGLVWVIGDDPSAHRWGHRIGTRTVWVNRAGKQWPTSVTQPHAQFDDAAQALDHVVVSSR